MTKADRSYKELLAKYQDLKANYDLIVNSRSWRVIAFIWRLKTKYKVLTYRKGQLLNFIVHQVRKIINANPDRKFLLKLVHNSRKKIIIIQPPSIDWNIPQFQRPQHLALNLSKLGCLFLYCTSNNYDNVNGFQEINDHLYLTNRFDLIKKYLHKGWIIIHAGHPDYTIQEIEKYKQSGFKIIYDYVDKIDPLINGNSGTVARRHNLMGKSNIDLGLATARNLYLELKKKIGSQKTLLNPNGVDLEHFSFNHGPPPVPADLKPIVDSKKPIIGYYGALAKWIDYSLINKIARNHPEWNFVFIGWDYDCSVSKLQPLANIFYLGVKKYEVLPNYAYYFDVAIIPFLPGGIAKSTSPLKLFEYFALGKQVIITRDLDECKPFKGVYIGKNTSDFASKIDMAIKLRHEPQIKEALLTQARENTWQSRAQAIYNLICHPL